MGKIVIVVYRPKKGKEKALLTLIEEHLPILKSQQLVTDRKPVVMRAGDGLIVEIFEWKSSKAIESAHTNAAVQALWGRFSEVCDYDMPANVKEFHNLFSEFEAIN